MTTKTRRIGLGLAFLSFSRWSRRQAWLRAIFQRIPQSWRDRLSAHVVEHTCAKARFPKTAPWNRPLPQAFSLRADSAKFAACTSRVSLGVNILGYIGGQFGLAESARSYARALIRSDVNVSLFDVDLGLAHAWEDKSLDAWIDSQVPHPVSIIFINPDHLQPALEQIGTKRMEGRRLVACWFWELEVVPRDWIEAIEHVDAIMVASEFIEQAFRRVTSKPVFRVPLPVGDVVDSGLQRHDFGLDDGKFVFLTTFDFSSWIARKNPFAVLRAFTAAFPAERDDVCLMVKSSNGFRHFDKFRELLEISRADPRIVIRDEVIERAHLHALQRCCDAYVSLHRSEGFGLGLAECMLIGKPVIATAWSGNMEFMTPQNSCLVGYRMVDVGPGEYPWGEGQRWAEADVSEAAAWMRRLADKPALACQVGAAARASVMESLSFERAAALLIENVSHVTRAAHRQQVDLSSGNRATCQ